MMCVGVCVCRMQHECGLCAKVSLTLLVCSSRPLPSTGALERMFDELFVPFRFAVSRRLQAASVPARARAV